MQMRLKLLDRMTNQISEIRSCDKIEMVIITALFFEFGVYTARAYDLFFT